MMKMHTLAEKDLQHIWHPFTQMSEWMKEEPIVIVSGKGALLTDQHGRRYLDGNASIWTNLHGHGNAVINRAIKKQLSKISHSSSLGLANEPASLLAEQFVKVANPATVYRDHAEGKPVNPRLEKVFFSDNGSTALETALKLACECAKRGKRGGASRFLSLENAYHGDTVGAVSLGQVDLFHQAYSDLLFPTQKVMSPCCYRCPFNRAKPERADARTYRQCHWECVQKVGDLFDLAHKDRKPFTGFVFEPLIQGVAGMVAHPEGWLRRVAALARQAKTLLIADEVMTGFGRTGSTFACHQEGIQPDFLCLAKGMTGGYLPMAATLTTRSVFDQFLGSYESLKTFFHGHSYTGNQLGASASLASLGILEDPDNVVTRKALATVLGQQLDKLWKLPWVGDIRRVGLIAGVELVRDWKSREAWPMQDQVGIRVCREMARLGVLTRPIGNVIVLMPPYCCSKSQVRRMVSALTTSIKKVLGEGKL
jgi:adenosylmethionine---8-amino-7-oxononanoate aminotransferase